MIDKEQNGYPAILVDETFNDVYIKYPENQKEEFIKNETKTRQKIFMWDEQLGWFGNEKTLIGAEPPAVTHQYQK